MCVCLIRICTSTHKYSKHAQENLCSREGVSNIFPTICQIGIIGVGNAKHLVSFNCKGLKLFPVVSEHK